MAPPLRPAMHPQQDSLRDLTTQSEYHIKSWTGFSREAGNLHDHSVQSQHYFQHTRNPLNQTTFLGVREDQTARKIGAITPPIPDRAPGRPTVGSPSSRRLKRKSTPRLVSLRDLRAQQSEAALRSIYESQTDAYLNNATKLNRQTDQTRRLTKWSMSDSSGEEDIKEEPED